MFFRLSAHSPRDSGVRRMCCSSWQILHLFSVSVAPGPETSFSWPWESPFRGKNATRKQSARDSGLNHHPDAVHAVPEVAERIPGRHHRLRVAPVVPGARQDAQVAAALRLELVAEAAPRLAAAARAEPCPLPAPAFGGGDIGAAERNN